MYGKTLLIFLVAVGAASAYTISGVGKCKVVSALSDFDFEKFSKENGGVWNYKLVPDTPKYANVKSQYLKSEVQEDGKSHTKTYTTEIGSTTPSVTSDQIRESVGNGHVTGKGVKTNFEFDIYYLAYKPGQYACFFICSDEGAETYDTVVVLSNKASLTAEEKKEISKLIKDNNLNVPKFKEL